MHSVRERQPAQCRLDDAQDCAEAVGRVLTSVLWTVTREPLPPRISELLAAMREAEVAADAEDHQPPESALR
jgi:hypothetical protein